MDELRRRARQRLEVWFEGAVPEGMAGVEGLAEGWRTAGATQPASWGRYSRCCRFLATQPVAGMLVEEPDLEEAFLDLYEEES